MLPAGQEPTARFELTEQDLHDAQAVLLAHRRHVLQTHPASMIAAATIAGLLVWPLWNARLTGGYPFQTFQRSLLGYAGALMAATLIALGLQRLLPTPRWRKLYAWAAKRNTRIVLPRSVLGEVTVRATDAGLVRINSTGELLVPWSEVRLSVRSPSILVMLLKDRRRMVALPTRAFPEPGALEQFALRVQAASGKRVVSHLDP